MSWLSSFIHGVGGVVHDVVKGVGHAVGDVIHVVGENIVPIVIAIAAYFTAGAAAAAAGAGGAAAGAGAAAGSGVAAGAGVAAADSGAVAADLAATSYTAGMAASGAAAAVSAEATTGVMTYLAEGAAVLKGVTSLIAKPVNYVESIAKEVNASSIMTQGRALMKYYDEARGLYAAVKESLTMGFKGMLQIPQEIANTMGNIAAINMQIANKRIAGSTIIANDIVAPAIIRAGEAPITELTQIISQYTALPEVSLDGIPEQKLTEPPNLSGLIDDYEADIQYISKMPGFIGELARGAKRLMYLGPLLLEHIKQPIKQFAQQAKHDNPLELLGIGDLVEAIKRDEIDVLAAVDEAKKQGVDESRLNILMELAKPLLSVNEALDASFRGIIPQGDAQAEITKHGYDATRFDVLSELAYRVPAANDTFTWLARGGISEAEAKELLRHAHFTNSQITLILETGFKPVSAAQYTQQSGLFDAVTKGYLADTMSTPAPDKVVEAHRHQGLDKGQAQANWLGHWQDLPISKWIDGYFRGHVTRSELTLAFTAKNVPPEIQTLQVDVERELIPIWLAPEILSAGVVSREDGHLMLAKLGLDEANIKLILDYSDAKQNAPKFKQLDALAQLSIGNLKEMYAQGMIDESQYETGLQDHGYSVETAVLLAKSERIKKVLHERKEYANGLVNEAVAGSRDKDNVNQLLFDAGFSAAEVASYLNKIHTKAQAKSRLPGEAMLAKMHTKGLISIHDYVDTLVKSGFSTYWANNIANLNFPGEL